MIQAKSNPSEEKIIQFLAHYLGVDQSVLQPQADLASDLNLQALDLIELGTAIAKEFQIEIEEEDAADWQSVADIVHTTSEKILSKPVNSLTKA